MSELLSMVQTAGVVLGGWAIVSVAAAVPIIGWFRWQAAANEAQTCEGRRRDWLAASRPAIR